MNSHSIAAIESVHLKKLSKHALNILRAKGFDPDKMTKQVEVQEYAFGCVSRQNHMRKIAIKIATSRYFDWFIIAAIITNSLFLGMTDYSVVDDQLNPVSQGFQYQNGTLIPKTSMRNRLLEISEFPFTAIFTFECLIKVIALGFIRGKGAYLKDTWNLLDFVVVLSSLVGIFPGVPNVSALRTIRVLRPLRSLSVIPGMRRLITALLQALPALGNVIILQIFVFFIFGILGIQLFGGDLNSRCRLTPFPVKLEIINGTTLQWPVSAEYLEKVLQDPKQFACLPLDVPLLNNPLKNMTKEESPWYEPQDCFWPIDQDDVNLCDDDGSGMHQCVPGLTCGSNYDAYGNERFKSLHIMREPRHNAALNWGFTSFDHIGSAFFTIFQSITQEAWTIVMYMCMDTSPPIVSALFFVLLIIFAAFFLMNLTLAVITEEFSIDSENEKAVAKELKEQEQAKLEQAQLEQETGAVSTKKKSISKQQQKEEDEYPTTRVMELELRHKSVGPIAVDKHVDHLDHHSHARRLYRRVRHKLYHLISSGYFTTVIMLAILANTTVLALDHHPMPPELDDQLELINFGLSCIFFVEMVLKLFALTPRVYFMDKFNTFDAFVVTIGLVELGTSPPTLLIYPSTAAAAAAEASDGGGSAVSALRAFRLFRVFKLARNWKSLRDLLKTIIATLSGIANFAVLLFLFIYIYALMGLQFFANTMRFDADGYVINPDEPGFWEAEVPRNNFDSLLWAMVTVFQVITGENWNNLMYDTIRANGYVACIYFIALVIMGDFILMNLFLALLLDNFGGGDDEEDNEEDNKEYSPFSSSTSNGRQNSSKSLLLTTITPSTKVKPLNVEAHKEEEHDDHEELATTTPTTENASATKNSSSSSNLDTSANDTTSTTGTTDLAAVLLVKRNDTLKKELEKISTRAGGINSVPSSEIFATAAAILTTDKKATSSLRIKSLSSRIASLHSVIAPEEQVSSNSKLPNESLPALNVQEEEKEESQEEIIKKRIPPGKSLFLFGSENKMRQFAFALINDPRFDGFILLLITLSSLSLAIDNPLANPNSTMASILEILDHIFGFVFLFEMLLKILAMGLVFHKGSYLRNSWNVLDSMIVMSSMVMLFAELTGESGHQNKIGKSLRSLRSLRTFRPLRMISRRPGLKLVVNALLESVPAVLNVAFVCFLFYLIFSIVAVNYFKGTFYACSGDVFDQLTKTQVAFLTNPIDLIWTFSMLDVNAISTQLKNLFRSTSQLIPGNFPLVTANQDIQSLLFQAVNTSSNNSTCGWDIAYAMTSSALAGKISVANKKMLTSKQICQCIGAEWNPVLPQNFDHVGHALLTFFELSTTEGWADIMMAAIDATDIDMQPIRDNKPEWAYFFVAFMLVGSFFVINLFVGVIIDNFNRMKSTLGGDFLLTAEQKKWIDAQRKASKIVPIRIIRPPKNHIRRHIYEIVEKNSFEWFIMICIVLNTVLMAGQYAGQSTAQTEIFQIINTILAVIFTLEGVLKGLAYGENYFQDLWNRFDFCIIIATIASIIIEELTGSSVRSVAMLVRVFRVARILRLIKASKSIRHIFATLYIALPQLSNITSILFLMLFIYATMGVQLFAKVALHNNIDYHANFQDFWTAMLFLLRIATGENWNGCMHDYVISVPDCVDDPEYDPQMCGFNTTDGCVPLNGCSAGYFATYLYFCSFTLLVTYVMLNLTIAVILEGFSLSQEDDEPLFEPELLNEFQRSWANIDQNAKGFIHASKILLLIHLMEPPLGKHYIKMDASTNLRYLRALNLPLYEGETIYFKDVLLAMTREMVKEVAIKEDPDAINKVTNELEEEVPRAQMEFTTHEYFATVHIQHIVQEWLKTKRNLERQFMEEYKNKIKKPSGRPKKIRGARVYTTDRPEEIAVSIGTASSTTLSSSSFRM